MWFGGDVQWDLVWYHEILLDIVRYGGIDEIQWYMVKYSENLQDLAGFGTILVRLVRFDEI